MSTPQDAKLRDVIGRAIHGREFDLGGYTLVDSILEALAEEGWAVVELPNAASPSPALIEAAYITQDDLSKPPEQWAIEAAAEIITEYIDGQDHDVVHVLGHAQNVAAAEAVES